ncbi:MAG: hypothetical protein WC608_04760 [Parcubacteria group bacterium]
MENEPETNIETGKAKQWLQDNLRIIISILIVVAIAGGIYSYSKRSQSPSQDLANQEMNQPGEGTTEGIVAGDKTTAGTNTENKQGVAAATSQETDNSFIETAGKGDSRTKLARMALANYLEKNPDSTLTPEHKIYIEDYLRKNVPPQRVFVGTSLEFSKDLIQNAITKSKTLNDRQLKNLHKYSVLVPSLT